ncbi:hypothetical protein [Brevibacterium aurantiacum]|uniref:ATP-grasp domain-containing protein n=1 Tax=Brevibacterium aurantiacum TaxID=273384 RepID=A0A2A3X4I2_BREAU|nr:hypothetical protein [Brevibacterium aurantiacum]PCC18685.1 hypothetical protein CIK79_10510 [Brevibacterium aurantiacum]
MSLDYSLLKKFVRQHMLEANLPINNLATTVDAIRSITDKFAERGWSVSKIQDESSRHRKHEIKSPEGHIELSMIGGKVYRHPVSTEQICRRKHLTKKMLDLASLPTPAGADFGPKEQGVARAFFEMMPKPVVVKPTDSGSSHGVTVGVTDLSSFNSAWEYALDEGRHNSNVLIEEFVRGVELRAFVIGESVVSVFARIQPFVVGDQRSTVEHLVDDLGVARSVHYRAHRMPVKVDWDFVLKEGYEAQSVPDSGEIVFLNSFNYPSMGSFLVDVTGDTAEGIKDLARRARASIPSLEIAGVDLLVEDISDTSTATVLEVNTAASLDLHRYPTHGSPRQVDEDIVEYFDSLR